MPRAAADPAALLYTGGTTGRAKGVLSHENLWFAGRRGTTPAICPRSCAAPRAALSHAYGLLVTVVGFHAVEQHPSVLMRWFDPAVCLELMREHRTQITAVVPSMLQPPGQPVEDYDLTDLRYVVSGGSPLPTDVAEEFLRRVPQVEIREGYGLTETAALVTSTPPGGARSAPWASLLRASRCASTATTRSARSVLARGVMLGYWQAPELTAEAIQDGWLYTGDLGTSTRTGISTSSIGRRI